MHTYTLYERLILNRITPTVESRLIKEQAGFRPGKSCTSQLQNLTQHVEDGYQNRMNTGAALIDFSAAYDTVNLMILIDKTFNTTRDSPLCRVIQNMLSSRRCYVELNNERSRWRKQKNGLPQGSVLSPVLFNIIYKRPAYIPWNKEFYLCRRALCHSPVSILHRIEETIEDALEKVT